MLRALIVDDDEDHRLLVELWLAERCVTAGCASVAAALEVLRARRFDLILVDLVLPGEPGHVLPARLRADERTAPLGIVAMTAAAAPPEPHDLRRAGFDAWLTKAELSPATLDGILEHVLGRRAPPPSRAGSWVAAARVGALDAARARLAARFDAGLARRAVAIERAWRRSHRAPGEPEPATELRRLLHSLAGTAEAYGRVELATAARHAERLAATRMATLPGGAIRVDVRGVGDLADAVSSVRAACAQAPLAVSADPTARAIAGPAA